MIDTAATLPVPVSFLVLAIVGLFILLLGLLVALSKRRRRLEQIGDDLKEAQAQLERFAPIDDLDRALADRRRMIEEEGAAATAAINAAREALEQETRRQRADLQTQVTQTESRLRDLRSSIAEVSATLADYELKLDLEEMGFYQPKFEFENAPKYAAALALVREAQRELIRQKRVFDGAASNVTKGTRGLGALGLDAFNGDATTLISEVRFDNFEASKEKLRVEFAKVNRCLAPFGIQIAAKYLELKVKEMALAYDYRQAEEAAEQEQAEIKEMMKEEEEARVEAEREREEALEEEQRYEAALEQARRDLEAHSIDERASYESKIRELELELEQARQKRERATSMAQITRKGHVYIISNIGSFGENVFKIGMTRRKDPKDRIHELGDASVPFRFDVHALAESDDAPALETQLHRRFEARRINRVNMRKEFFRVTIDEIEQACAELGTTVALTKVAEANEYRQSRQIRDGAAEPND